MKQQGCRIDIWGVGTKLITSENCPALGGVYKLAAIDKGGVLQPKIKISENSWKITNPGYKKVVRIYGNSTGMAIADLIMLDDETIDPEKPLTIFHPQETWKKMTLTNFHVKELMVPVFRDGKQVYTSPSVMEIQQYAKEDMATFWDEYRRFVKQHLYKVDLSDKLYQLKKDMLNQER